MTALTVTFIIKQALKFPSVKDKVSMMLKTVKMVRDISICVL